MVRATLFWLNKDATLIQIIRSGFYWYFYCAWPTIFPLTLAPSQFRTGCRHLWKQNG
ncbi:hypothetical protein CNECB9_840002 [Cupriavidus necator]|uniref:Uncharacterized protein n=1 Tax=Cupriavidus necator TaxID=106590 RepID=A0A1K0ISK2_CUPNE|nr:hypothetical protein CNECB9_840002 [Cupriavidus necator]